MTMGFWLLEYQLADDYLDRRPAFRGEHLGLATAARDRGELVLALERLDHGLRHWIGPACPPPTFGLRPRVTGML